MNRQATFLFIVCILLLQPMVAPKTQAQHPPPDTSLVGTWITRGPQQVTTFSLSADGTYTVDIIGDSQAEVEGTYTRVGDEIRIIDTGGPLACPDEGRYTYRLTDESLLFAPVEDRCEGRMMTIALIAWTNKDRLAAHEKAIARNSDDADAYIHRGRLRLILGDAEGAAHDFDKALTLAPDNAQAYAGRGAWKLLNGNDRQGALTDFDRAVRLDPENGLMYFRRAWVKWHTGDKKGSCQDLEAAIRLGLPLEQKYATNCQ